MLYTVVPLEMIYPGETPKTEEEQRDWVKLIWRVDGGERRLVRVISSDLRDYLKYRL